MRNIDWQTVPTSETGGLTTKRVEVRGIVAARYELPAGFDSRPLYRGLPQDRCPCEHWCVLLSGAMRYHVIGEPPFDVATSDTFFVPRGHVADVLEDSVLIEFTQSEDDGTKQQHLGSIPAGELP